MKQRNKGRKLICHVFGEIIGKHSNSNFFNYFWGIPFNPKKEKRIIKIDELE